MLMRYEKLLQPQHRLLWQDYCHYLTIGCERYGGNRFAAGLKLEKLRLLERAIRKDFPLPDTLLSRLQKHFVANNLSTYLLLEPVQAWRYLAAPEPLTEVRLAEIIGRLAAPAGRLLMALNDENPSTYLPMTALLTAEMRFEWIAPAKTRQKILKSSAKKLGRNLDGLWKNAFVILSVIHSKRLKFRLAIFLEELRIKIKRRQNNKQLDMDFLDRTRIFLYSAYHFITIKRRTTNKQEM